MSGNSNFIYVMNMPSLGIHRFMQAYMAVLLNLGNRHSLSSIYKGDVEDMDGDGARKFVVRYIY